MSAAHASTADRLVALNAAPEVSRATLCRLALDLPAWSAAPAAALPELAAALAVPLPALRRAAAALLDAAAVAERERRAAAGLGARVITLADADYPAPLRQLALPPPVLYCRGALPAGPAVAVVGSRRPTDYGRETAWWFARELARQGAVVVSGFARGVDGAAHRGALAGGGPTVAVLGCGLDVPYPLANHRHLAAPIPETGGALLSELPMGTPPLKQHFPVRNRIIAALARTVLVVEAACRSGSLITAHLALELGREVLAVPGRLCDETAQGCNALIADGARPALRPADLLPELGLAEPRADEEAAPPLPGLAARLWAQLPPTAVRGPEALARACGAGVDETLAALLELELGGWVARLPGPAYCRRG